MNLGVYILAIAAFVIGTVELIIGGILNLISADLDVSISASGQLISVYSIVFAISAPLLLSLTANWERKRLYILMLIIFLCGSLLSAISPNYLTLLVSRIILAASASLMTVLSLSIASDIVEPSYQGRAMGIIAMGISGSLVLGVPLGMVIGASFGWRAAFLLIAVFTIIALIAVSFLLPKVPAKPVLSLNKQLATLKNSKIVSAHLVNILMLAGHLTLYAYLAPFLKTTLYLDEFWTSLVYFVFGIAAVTGGGLGGYSVDKWSATKMILLIIGVFTITLAILPFTTGSLIIFFPVMIIWSMFSWAITPALQHYLIHTEPQSSDIQLGLNTSSSHIGIALGSAVGGLVIENFPVVYNAWAGALIVAVAFACAIFSITRPKADKVSA